MNFYFFNALKYRYYRAWKRFKFSHTRAEKVKKPKKIAMQNGYLKGFIGFLSCIKKPVKNR